MHSSHQSRAVRLIAAATAVMAIAACRAGASRASDAVTGRAAVTSAASPHSVSPLGRPDTGAYLESEVDRPVTLKYAEQPKYPDELKARGTEGETVIQFVVDQRGFAEMRTFRVLRSTHYAFDQAVREALPRFRFVPAQRGGHAVRQVVQEPFTFALAH